MIGLLKDIFIAILYICGIMGAAICAVLLFIIIVRIWQEWR